MEDQALNVGGDRLSDNESTNGDSSENGNNSLHSGSHEDNHDASSVNSLQDYRSELMAENNESSAPAKYHSYLPGASHPLFPEQMLDRRRRVRSNSFSRLSVEGTTTKRSRSSSQSASNELQFANEQDNAPHTQASAPCHCPTSRLVELPILELNGVVLFPGSTIPIRLRSRDWIEYLGRKIDTARGIRGSILDADDEEVRLGILTYVNPQPARVPEQRQRRSWMRTAINISPNGRSTAMIAFWNEYDRLLRESVSDFEIDSDNENRTDREEGDAQLEEDTGVRRNDMRQQSRSNSRPLDPLIGRIGTMATITYTHEDAVGGDDVADAHQDSSHIQYSRVWRRSETDQLVVTALGTGRFRIVSCIDGNDDDGSPSRRRRSGLEGDMATVRLYQIEELTDEELPLPPVELRKKTTSAVSDSHTDTAPFLARHQHIVRNLSQVTPIPFFVYHYAWPWRLVGLIRETLDRNPVFEGLRKALPPLPGSDDVVHSDQSAPSDFLLDPLRFSFWMSCNMTFSEKEKLELLEMNCAIERLRRIYRMVLEQEQHEAFVCCKTCSRKLSRSANLFTVSGAEGTTGAYVNEHGIVHQTVTLRQVDEQSVFCSGGPETKDSWFPGYSWTITYCSFCHSHLGWKFNLVGRNWSSPGISSGSQQNDQDRPDVFWGLSGSAISTKIGV